MIQVLTSPTGGLQPMHTPAASSTTTTTTTAASATLGRRSIWSFFGKRKDDSPLSTRPGQLTNPVLDQYLKKKPKSDGPVMQRGDLAGTSIFEKERQAQDKANEELEASNDTGGRNHNAMASILDPHPAARERWQRKMVIRDLRKGGRLNKEMFIKRTERESVGKSENIKTSIKKLGPIARQIAGKTVDDAIVQLRFSKKKAAVPVLDYLEYARDEAIVARGMGLGQPTVADSAKNTDIRLKDGKRHKITDPTAMYIDQAWVGRGPYGKLPEYRAKGKTNILRTPWTHIGIVLKEEATRVRLYNEREDKRRKQRETKVWTPLPDRPIQGQRQWYSW
jgi:ribosomal protein L22